jgi:hypothetical protein
MISNPDFGAGIFDDEDDLTFPCDICGKTIDPDICKGTGLCDHCKEREGMDRMGNRIYFDDNEPDDSYWDESCDCHYCGGEGWGIVGTDWDSDDPINGPYPGEIERCPCCGGSGDADDCTFW